MNSPVSVPIVTGVTSGPDFRLTLEFRDGRSGIVDISTMVAFTGVFEPLRDHDYFVRVRVDPELGSIAWPNGADLDPLVLYAAATGLPID